MTWTTELDARILALASEGMSASTIAAILGDGFTKDSVQKRLKRIRDFDESPPVPEHEVGVVLPEPEDGFVGLRLGFFDIEATGLNAIVGRMLAAAIADSWGNVTVRRADEFDRSSPLDDSGLAEWYRDELERYDVLVSWNGFGYDVPMLNARLLRWGKRPMADRMQIDAMWKAGGGRYGIRVGSRRLDNVAKFFRLEEAKTPLDWDTWQLAGVGDEDALAEVVEHNVADVLVTRRVFNHLKPMVRTIHR